MSVSNTIIFFLSILVCAISLFFVLRLIEPMQDIYFGKISSIKEIFRITIVFIFLITIMMYGFMVAFFIFQNPSDDLTIRELLSLGIVPLITIPVSLIGIYWSYFSVGRSRNWLFRWLRRRSSENLKEPEDIKHSPNDK